MGLSRDTKRNPKPSSFETTPEKKNNNKKDNSNNTMGYISTGLGLVPRQAFPSRSRQTTGARHRKTLARSQARPVPSSRRSSSTPLRGECFLCCKSGAPLFFLPLFLLDKGFFVDSTCKKGCVSLFFFCHGRWDLSFETAQRRDIRTSW